MPGSSNSAPHYTKSAQELYNAGKAHCQSGQYDAALSELREAAAKTPNSAAVYFWLGKTQAGRGDTADAVASFQRSACLDSTNAKPHLEMGKAHVAADQLGAAMAALRQAQKLSPHSAEPLRQIAAVLIQQCQYDAAFEELQQALPLEPASALTHTILGRVYDLKGMKQQADAAYRESERLDPSIYAQAQIANGAQMETAGNYSGAIKQYQAATLTDPTCLDAFLRLGGANLEKKYVTAAADAFRIAVRLDPNCFVAHYTLGWLLLEMSLVNLKALLFKAKTAPPDEAIRVLRRAVELKPDETAAHLVLGKTYQAAGVRHLAREQFEQVLVLSASGEDAALAREALKAL